MALTQQDFPNAYQGCDWLLEITVTDADNGGIKDLSGASAEWFMQPKSTSVTPTIHLANVTITNAKNGVLEVSVPNTQTNVGTGDYYHVVVVTDALGKREPTTIGTVTVVALPQG